ncbi:MAG: hypothetical protein KF802_04810 [Bdellovibrionaceae bacterium]|nr:hypothetical protein [Pseudobdellovibrionaceae bacterium]MBX3034019.1 hypothetical protein [Pseudobdellovibrionaceae bacterium]
MLMLICVGTAACAAKERPQGRPHPATLANDLFQVEQGMPVREVKPNQPFFFKKCEMSRSRPYFTKTEYECNDAP